VKGEERGFDYSRGVQELRREKLSLFGPTVCELVKSVKSEEGGCQKTPTSPAADLIYIIKLVLTRH
jgi:hypothetical protein